MKINEKPIGYTLFALLLLSISFVLTVSAADRLCDNINALRGTNNIPGGYSYGNTVPATCLPHGFNLWTPMTDATSTSWIYVWNATKINAFACSHIPSPWIEDYAQMQFMPQIGSLQTSATNRLASFSHTNEIAKGYYYSVTLSNGIKVEIAPTMHAACIRFTFPAGSAHIVFSSITGRDGSITVNQANRTISGYIDHNSPRMYFYATIDAEIASFGYPSDAGIAANVDFTTGSNQVVTMKMGTSFISSAQAIANVTQEIGQASFDQIKDVAATTWDSLLGKIAIAGATDDQKITFYSNMYRSFVYPSAFWEAVNGSAQYMSPFDNKVHDGKLYVNNGFWDTFKSAWPLYVLLEPTIAGDMLNGLVDAFKQAGAIPRWIAPGFKDAMVSTHYNVIFADAYIKGLRNFDYTTAYQSSLKDATTFSNNGSRGRKCNDRSIFLGYVPQDAQKESVSWTLENGMCDAAISRMADALGKPEDYAFFKNRALWYMNIWSPSVNNFFRGKSLNGSWRTTDNLFFPNEWGYEFCEGCAWHYRFGPAYDGQGLANLWGGRSNLSAAIDQVFAADRTFRTGSYGTIHEMNECFDSNKGQYNHTNQPDHYMIYLYNYAGTPSKTAYHVRDVLTTLYTSGINDGKGYLGDEDNGSMASWYVFSALGIFPASGAVPEYLIGSPLFASADIHLENGKTFTITNMNNNSANIYVQSASLNSSNLSRNFITHSAITAGGTLTLNMGSSPSTWGTGLDDVPSSMTVGTAVPSPAKDIAFGGTIAASGESTSSGEGADKAFDNNSQTKWITQTGTGWIEYRLPSAKPVDLYTLTSANDFPARDPKSWTLKGSNDGSVWTILDTRSDQLFTWRYQTRYFNFTSTTPYTIYRLEITQNNGAPYTQLAEIELLEGSNSSTRNTPHPPTPRTFDNLINYKNNIIALSKPGSYTLHLYRMDGRIAKKRVLQGPGNYNVINDLNSNGMYILTIDGHGEHLRKVLLQNK